MNVKFLIKAEGGEPQSFVVGRSVRSYFKEEIEWNIRRNKYFFETSKERGTIDDSSDGGAEWELCEALGVNPGKYVGRINFRYELECENAENNLYKVTIEARKAA